MTSLFRKIDCLSIPVPDLQSGIDFYSNRLGHTLIWKTSTMAGMALPESEAELVLHTDKRPMEAELLVSSVPEAIRLFTASGGKLAEGPFEIQIGQCAVLTDPWDNRIVILDMSKGKVKVDSDKKVIGNGA